MNNPNQSNDGMDMGKIVKECLGETPEADTDGVSPEAQDFVNGERAISEVQRRKIGNIFYIDSLHAA